jgi:hypothetical protein
MLFLGDRKTNSGNLTTVTKRKYVFLMKSSILFRNEVMKISLEEIPESRQSEFLKVLIPDRHGMISTCQYGDHFRRWKRLSEALSDAEASERDRFRRWMQRRMEALSDAKASEGDRFRPWMQRRIEALFDEEASEGYRFRRGSVGRRPDY